VKLKFGWRFQFKKKKVVLVGVGFVRNKEQVGLKAMHQEK